MEYQFCNSQFQELVQELDPCYKLPHRKKIGLEIDEQLTQSEKETAPHESSSIDIGEDYNGWCYIC